MDQMPAANAATKLTAQGTAPICATLSTAFRPSRIPAPAMTGIDIRKLNSAAAAGVRPARSAAATVAPEREIAGRIANACAKPIAVAAPVDGTVRAPVAPRVDQRIAPVIKNWMPSQASEWNAASI